MSRLLEFFSGQPWALETSTFVMMQTVLSRWSSEGKLPAGDIEAAVGDRARQAAVRRSTTINASRPGLVVVPVHGVLVHRAFAVEQVSTTLTSTERLSAELRGLAADPGVRIIVLDIDSPGGSVFGVQELATTLANIRSGGKRLVAVANNTAASGAYWIASQANEVVVTPSGMVGSIGVIVAHQDMSKAYEDAGIRKQYITAGKYKAENNELGPLGPEGRAHLQGMVDTYYAAFTKAVAKGRGVPVETARGPAFGQGRMKLAREAVDSGMADAIGTLEQTVDRHASGARIPVGQERRQLDGRLADIMIAELR